MTIIRHHVGPRLSKIAVHNGTVYLSGQIPRDPTQDIEGQTTQVLEQIDSLLGEVNNDKTQLLSVQIFVADMKYFPGVNAVWDKWVVAEKTPPRATVEANLNDPEVLVEIVVVAAQK